MPMTPLSNLRHAPQLAQEGHAAIELFATRGDRCVPLALLWFTLACRNRAAVSALAAVAATTAALLAFQALRGAREELFD